MLVWTLGRPPSGLARKLPAIEPLLDAVLSDPVVSAVFGLLFVG